MREPLVWFLVLGAAIFAFDGARTRLDLSDTERRIEVTAKDVERMRELWIAQSGWEPSPEDLRMMIYDHIREEILYREALRLALDRDDTIIRRRLAQKMTFLMEDTGTIGELDESALVRFFDKHKEKYERPARATFEHVYFSPERRGDHASIDAGRALHELQTKDAADASGRGLGDPFLLAMEYAGQTRNDIARLFGEEFASAVEGLELDQWSGPVSSAYGFHLVRLTSRESAALPAFAEIRDRVLEDYRVEGRQNANKGLYEELRKRYQVRMAEGIEAGALARHEGSAP